MADIIPVHIKELGTRPVDGTERLPNQRSTESIAYQNSIDAIHNYRWHHNSRVPTTSDNAAAGYGLDHVWVDDSANPPGVYVKTAEAGGVAVWTPTSGGSGGGSATSVTESGGPTALVVGAIADGEFVRRVGATLVGTSGVGTLVENVSSSRALTAADNNKTLLVTGGTVLTAPASLGSPVTVNIVNVGSGTVGAVAGAGATLEPGAVSLPPASDVLSKATLHTTGGTDWFATTEGQREESFMVAVSDEFTNIEALPSRLTFAWPHDFLLTDMIGFVNEAPVGANIVLDVNVNAATILSTKLTIEAGETSSATATTQPVIGTEELSKGDVVTVDIDQVGSDTPGRGVKLTFYGYRV